MSGRLEEGLVYRVYTVWELQLVSAAGKAASNPFSCSRSGAVLPAAAPSPSYWLLL